jgi:5-methyltetrahydrofolate--homocysteine methyltransferase
MTRSTSSGQAWLDQQFAEGVLLMDGAMGSMLLHAGLTAATCAQLWNIDHQEAVEDVHRSYAEAGSRVVSANTFGGSALALERHSLADRCGELSAAAVQIARRAVGDDGWVLGDIGPFGGFLEPYGETTEDEFLTATRVQIEAFQEAGADGVIVETMADPIEMSLAVGVAREAGDWPVLASYAFQRTGEGFRTMMGATVRDALAAALSAGADAVGANCGTNLSMSDYVDLAPELVAASQGVPVLLQPNAGEPRFTGASTVYLAPPEELAHCAVSAIAAGVRIFGGCCGTTPDHIRAVAEALGVLPIQT